MDQYMGLIPWLGRFPGERNGFFSQYSSSQYSCLGNPIDRGAWWATIHQVAKESRSQKSRGHKRVGHELATAAATAAKSLQSCPTLCDPIDGSPPGSPVPGILQARVPEWGAIAFSGVSN